MCKHRGLPDQQFQLHHRSVHIAAARKMAGR
jgi:hypothetical protein